MTTISKNNKNKEGITYANGESAFFINDGASLGSCPNNSTAIRYWEYEIGDKQLTVRYRKSDTYYCYKDVPFEVVFGLMLAESLGHFIATEVKPNYSVISW